MADKIYLRPLGIIRGQCAEQAVDEGIALRLCGGPAAFLAGELIEGAPGKAKRVVARAATLAAIDEPVIAALLERIAAPRPAVAGLNMRDTLIMGVLNVTPDSFSDGGEHFAPAEAVAHARRMIEEGAAIIDVGGESTRPGAGEVPLAEEEARVIPVVQALRELKALISIDTRKARIMSEAAAAGAAIINDVSALTFDPDSLAASARLQLPVVLMHARGTPETMQDDPRYEDVLLEVYDFLDARLEAAVAAGLPRDRLIVDPGIGFGKTLEHNLALMEGLSLFHGLGVPVLVGASRKSFIARVTGEADVKKRDFGSVAAAIAAAAQGVQIVRVHNVAATRQGLRVWQAAMSGQSPA
jgi:dihydropteroate synthase